MKVQHCCISVVLIEFDLQASFHTCRRIVPTRSSLCVVLNFGLSSDKVSGHQAEWSFGGVDISPDLLIKL